MISLARGKSKISTLKAKVKTNAAHKASFDTAQSTNYLEMAFYRIISDRVYEKPSQNLYVSNLSKLLEPAFLFFICRQKLIVGAVAPTSPNRTTRS